MYTRIIVYKNADQILKTDKFNLLSSQQKSYAFGCWLEIKKFSDNIT